MTHRYSSQMNGEHRSVISCKFPTIRHMLYCNVIAGRAVPESLTACQQQYRIRMISMVVWRGMWIPKCDAEGNFEPQQCDNTSTYLKLLLLDTLTYPLCSDLTLPFFYSNMTTKMFKMLNIEREFYSMAATILSIHITYINKRSTAAN